VSLIYIEFRLVLAFAFEVKSFCGELFATGVDIGAA
jgi:hypothetical protein